MYSLEMAKTCRSNLYIWTSVKTNSPANESENIIQNKKQEKEKNKRGCNLLHQVAWTNFSSMWYPRPALFNQRHVHQEW